MPASPVGHPGAADSRAHTTSSCIVTVRRRSRHLGLQSLLDGRLRISPAEPAGGVRRRILEAQLQPGELDAAECGREHEKHGGHRDRELGGHAAALSRRR